MEQYVALDVSLQKIAVCVLNASGRVVIEAEVASEPGVELCGNLGDDGVMKAA